MLYCIVAVVAAAILGAVAMASISTGISNGRQFRERLAEKAADIARCHLRIEALERMLDESRANVLGVVAPQARESTGPVPLPPEVIAELDEIEEDVVRAELEADIRLQLQLHPEQEPLAIARSVIGA